MGNFKLREIFNIVDISEPELEKMARETGFIKRLRSVSGTDMLFAFCCESVKGCASYNDIASQIEADNGIPVSKQAIWKKGTECCEDFFKMVLERIIKNKLCNYCATLPDMKNRYTRILVQDSTIIKLPLKLFMAFSGVANRTNKVCNARVQGVYDILNERFISFSIDPYTKNDLKAAPEMNIQKDDLTLRDRGYLIYDEIGRHIKNGADCIYRYKFGMTLLDPETEEPINILKKLKKNGIMDMEVKLNNIEKTIVRITAMPVDKEVASSRRRKAVKEKKLLHQKNTWSFCHGQYLLQQYL